MNSFSPDWIHLVIRMTPLAPWRDWYAGIAVRLGHAAWRTLIFAKAGGVYSRTELGFVDECIVAPCGTGLVDAAERAEWGYQLGLGLEHLLSDRWTAKAEYSYFDFGSSTIRGIADGVGFAGNVVAIDADLAIRTIKLGLNYRF